MKYSIPAVIFAGGKSSRMGSDKALLPFDGYATLAEYQYRRLQKYFHQVYLSAKKQKFPFDAPLILDTYTVSSPLVGIVSLFETLDTEAVFILSVDAPFVDTTVIGKLMQLQHEHYDAVIAKTAKGLQPLCGIYRRTILPAAYTALQENNHRLGKLLHGVTSQTVHFEEEKLFSNLNCPDEYENAYKRTLQLVP